MSTEEITKTNEKKPVSGMAIASMAMGIASIACCGFILVIPPIIFIVSGMTITFTVMGIISLACFGFGILAIILSLISLNKIKKGLQCGKKLAIAGLVTGIVGTVFIIIELSLPIPCAREPARRISCASNLKQIGLAIRMYSQENEKQFPDESGAKGWEMLRSGGYLENVKIYTCPSTLTVARDGELLSEENVSYVYIGGHNESSPLDTVIAYDKPNNHYKFRNVLFADGHVSGYADANWMNNKKK